jgi:hypothetical protein
MGSIVQMSHWRHSGPVPGTHDHFFPSLLASSNSSALIESNRGVFFMEKQEPTVGTDSLARIREMLAHVGGIDSVALSFPAGLYSPAYRPFLICFSFMVGRGIRHKRFDGDTTGRERQV